MWRSVQRLTAALVIVFLVPCVRSGGAGAGGELRSRGGEGADGSGADEP